VEATNMKHREPQAANELPALNSGVYPTLNWLDSDSLSLRKIQEFYEREFWENYKTALELGSIDLMSYKYELILSRKVNFEEVTP
jgi:hypothetical protein